MFVQPRSIQAGSPAGLPRAGATSPGEARLHTEAESCAEAEARAVSWLLDQHGRAGGQMLLLLPSMRPLAPDHPPLDALAHSPHVLVATLRTLRRCHWEGGPALVAWPDARSLRTLTADHRTTALCVLAPSMPDAGPWVLPTQTAPLGPRPVAAASARDDAAPLRPGSPAPLTRASRPLFPFPAARACGPAPH